MHRSLTGGAHLSARRRAGAGRSAGPSKHVRDGLEEGVGPKGREKGNRTRRKRNGPEREIDPHDFLEKEIDFVFFRKRIKLNQDQRNNK